MTKPDISARYVGQAGREYFSYQNQWGELSGRLNAWKFSPYLPSDAILLDFGCGGGWLLRTLPAARRIGLEVNPAAQEVCRAAGTEVYGRLEEVPSEVRFNAVITHHALEHVPCPVDVLRAIRGRMVPGGTLLVVVPIDDWRAQRVFAVEDIDHHLHTWTPRLLANTLRESGFAVREVRVLTHAWPPGVQYLAGWPAPLFNLLCKLWSVLRRRRQLLAVAVNSI